MGIDKDKWEEGFGSDMNKSADEASEKGLHYGIHLNKDEVKYEIVPIYDNSPNNHINKDTLKEERYTDRENAEFGMIVLKQSAPDNEKILFD